MRRLTEIGQTEPLTDVEHDHLKRGLASKTGIVVATAVRVIGERGLDMLAVALPETFERLLTDAVKRDPSCRAKIAIVEALERFDINAETLYRRGLSWVQLEAIWGGTSDTAGPLRAACAKALVDLRIWDLMARLVDLLADPEPPARIGAVHAMVAARRRDAIYPLRLKARLGDASADVSGACLEGVLALDEDDGVAFVVEFLQDADPAIVDQALLALGHSRRSEALAPLIAWLEAAPDPAETHVGLAAMVAHRSEEATAYLINRVAEAGEAEAMAVLDALAPMAFDPKTAERVRTAAAERTEPGLQRRVQAKFGE